MAVAIATAHEDHSTDEWPVTCVDLNDVVEEHLGSPHNVGIYQNTFGDQAELACQNDHRADVQATFGWALSVPSRAPAGGPTPGGWPTSCVDLNDIVEAHLNRPGNVGIYQRAYNDEAEGNCRSDHLADVQAAFAWASSGAVDTSPVRPVTPAAPISVPLGHWDPQLRHALDLLVTDSFTSVLAETWETLLDFQAAERFDLLELRVVFGDPGNPDWFGSYRLSTNTVTINTNLRTERPEALAAIVIHELIHAINNDPSRTEVECIETEASALIFQGLAWFSLTSDLETGILSASPQSRLEKVNHNLAVIWYADSGAAAFRQLAEDTYRDRCRQFS